MAVDFPQIVVGALIVWTVIFLVTLAHAMGRNDIDSIGRLTWVIVLIFVPFFGVLLYTLSGRQPDLRRRGTSGSDVSGTPWADDPGFTNPSPKH
jgi:hypothetical protein